jgi:hypothetical protein
MMGIHGHSMALRSSLAGVRLRGPSALLHRPDDFDDTYFARRGLVEASVPASMRVLRNARVSLFGIPEDFRIDETEPTSTVKAIAAFSLAYRWIFDGPDSSMARQVFDKGQPYVGALLDVDDYSAFRWGSFTPWSELFPWEVRPASKELAAAAVREVRSLASYRARQEQYRAYEARLSNIVTRVAELRARSPKARERLSWFTFQPPLDPWDLSSVERIWEVSGPLAPRLLVAYFDEGMTIVVPDRNGLGDGQEDLVFDGGLVVIWSLGTELESVLGEIAPAQGDKREIPNFTLRSAVGSATSLPALLFTAAGVTGALQPTQGRYTIDEEHAIRIP